MTLMELELLSSSQVAALGADSTTIGLITTGAIEQHGPHLPVSADTALGRAVSQGIGAGLNVPVLATPTIAVGVSDVHLRFAGTITLPEATFEGVVTAHIESLARAGVRRIAIVDCNVPNVAASQRAAQAAMTANPELTVIVYNDVEALMAALWAGADPGAGSGSDHAGRLETSIVLALLGSEVVQPFDDLRGFTDFDEVDWWGRMLREGIQSLDDSGIIGVPAGANAEEGHRMVAAFVKECCEWIATQLGPLTPNAAH